MTKPVVMILLVLFAFTINQVTSVCEDFTCSHGDRETRLVAPGDRCNYFTQPEGNQFYPPPKGVNCVVQYKPTDGCLRLGFTCRSCHIHNRHPIRCQGRDKMNVYGVEGVMGADIFCGPRTPRRLESRFEEELKIQLQIDFNTKGGQGCDRCRVTCVDEE